MTKVQPSKKENENLLSREEIWDLQNKMNDMGSRLTGNDAHKKYIELLKKEIESYNLPVYEDEQRFMKWEAKKWSLAIHKGSGQIEEIPTTFYYPYSGETDEIGVTGELVWCKNNARSFKKAKGKIAVVEVTIPTLPTSLILKKRSVYPPNLKIPMTLTNSVIGSVLKGPKLEEAAKAGVLGVICVWKNYSFENASMQNLPFTTGYKGCPGLWVDQKAGKRLLESAKKGLKATLVLEAEVDHHATSKTIYSILPGKNEKETIIINTHTDGPNACEENGGIALLSLMRYFARLPKEERNRTLVFVFVTGHFQIPQFGVSHEQASSRWLENHPELWDGIGVNKKAVAGVTIEHLGCSEWRDVQSGYRQTNPIEMELVYTGNKTMDEIYLSALEERTKVRSVTLRPHNHIYFGEGQPLYKVGIPTISLVPGPDYLCKETINGELDKLDLELMEEQIQTFFKVVQKIDQMSSDKIGTPQKQSMGIF